MKKLVEIPPRRYSRTQLRELSFEEYRARITAMEQFVLTRLQRIKRYQLSRQWERADELNELYTTAREAIVKLCELEESSHG